MQAGTALKESINKIIAPEEAEYSVVSLIIIAVAVAVKFIFGKYVKKVGKRINSQSLIATGTDAIMDSILSLSTLITAIINFTWHISLEGYLGAVIGVIIIKSSIDILKETANNMIGIRADSELTNKLREEINAYAEVQGVYDLSLHSYGPEKIVGSLHIQVRDNMSAREIHALSRKIIADILNKHGIILTIGIYAANDTGEFEEIKNSLKKIIENIPDILQMHGFYVDKETNTISFDVIIDFGVEKPDKIEKDIIMQMKEKFPQYNYNIILDTDISD